MSNVYLYNNKFNKFNQFINDQRNPVFECQLYPAINTKYK